MFDPVRMTLIFAFPLSFDPSRRVKGQGGLRDHGSREYAANLKSVPGDLFEIFIQPFE